MSTERHRSHPGRRIVVDGLTLEAAPATGPTKPKTGAAKATRRQLLGCRSWNSATVSRRLVGEQPNGGRVGLSGQLQPALPANSWRPRRKRLEAMNNVRWAGHSVATARWPDGSPAGRGRSLAWMSSLPRDRPLPDIRKAGQQRAIPAMTKSPVAAEPCQTCRALVRPEDGQAHQSWHRGSPSDEVEAAPANESRAQRSPMAEANRRARGF